jgi:hypothetical protein
MQTREPIRSIRSMPSSKANATKSPTTLTTNTTSKPGIHVNDCYFMSVYALTFVCLLALFLSYVLSAGNVAANNRQTSSNTASTANTNASQKPTTPTSTTTTKSGTKPCLANSIKFTRLFGWFDRVVLSLSIEQRRRRLGTRLLHRARVIKRSICY